MDLEYRSAEKGISVFYTRKERRGIHHDETGKQLFIIKDRTREVQWKIHSLLEANVMLNEL